MSDTSLLNLLHQMTLWHLDESKRTIARKFVFMDFANAFAFMSDIAKAAEQHNHHPEWRNVYNTVWIEWTTHDANGLSMKDVNLAQICDHAYMQYSKASIEN